MWSQLRSAVEDVKEFGSGAINEVSQGVHQGKKLAAQAPQLAGAAASFVEGRRQRVAAIGKMLPDSSSAIAATADGAASTDADDVVVPGALERSAPAATAADNKMDSSDIDRLGASPASGLQNPQADDASDSLAQSSSTSTSISAASLSPLRHPGPPRSPPDPSAMSPKTSQPTADAATTAGSPWSKDDAPSAATANPDASTHAAVQQQSGSDSLANTVQGSSAANRSIPPNDVSTATPNPSNTSNQHDNRPSDAEPSMQSSARPHLPNSQMIADTSPAISPAQGSSGSDAATLQRRIATLERQLAVEQQLAKALQREKADADASLEDLTLQVQQRDEAIAAATAEAAGLRAERHAVDAAVEELRTMLMQSVGERSRLAGEVEAAELRIAAAQQEAAEKVAATEAIEAKCADLTAKLHTAETALEQQHESNEAMSSVESEAFQGKVAALEQQLAVAHAAAAAANARSEAAERERDAAEAAAATADRLRHDVEAEAEAAAAAVDAERLHRTAATGEAEALRADAERRAAAFNAAVATAVGRIRADLEADQAALAARLEAAEQRAAAAQHEADRAAAAAADASAQVAAAREEAAAEAARAAAAEDATHRARSATLQAQQALAEAAAARDAAEGSRRGGEQQLAAALERAAQAETRCAELAADLQQARGAATAATDRGAVEVALWRERAETVTAELRQAPLTATGPPTDAATAHGPAADTALHSRVNDAMATAAAARADAARWQRQVADLEHQVADLQAAARKQTLRMPAASELLTSLGLEGWKDSRLGPKEKVDADLEAAVPRQHTTSLAGGLMAAASARRRQVVSQMRGKISARTWLVGGYLGLLHLLLMKSYTHRNDLEALCAGFVGSTRQLPGT